MRTFIYPYKTASTSARSLAQGLGAMRIKTTDSRYRHNPDRHLVINWGSSSCPDFDTMLNRPEAVRKAANKLHTFTALQEAGVSIPEYSVDPATARGWLAEEGGVVYARTRLTGHSGIGIEVLTEGASVVPAPLYVKGITGLRREYRIHVVNGEVIRRQVKRRRSEVSTEPNNEVRNLAGGWVFCTDSVATHDAADREAIAAVAALGLDFGAVDVITHQREAWVLEVNTACGIEGSTLEAYVNAFARYGREEPTQPLWEPVPPIPSPFTAEVAEPPATPVGIRTAQPTTRPHISLIPALDNAHDLLAHHGFLEDEMYTIREQLQMIVETDTLVLFGDDPYDTSDEDFTNVFDWSSTTQGHEFWQRVDQGVLDMSLSDTPTPKQVVSPIFSTINTTPLPHFAFRLAMHSFMLKFPDTTQEQGERLWTELLKVAAQGYQLLGGAASVTTFDEPRAFNNIFLFRLTPQGRAFWLDKSEYGTSSQTRNPSFIASRLFSLLT